MRKRIEKWIVLCTLTIVLSLGMATEAKAAEPVFAINGFINEFKTIDVGVQVVGVQGYSGMTFSGTTITVQIPSGYKDTNTLPAYFYYKDSTTGETGRATIYITMLYRTDADDTHQEYDTQVLEDSHKAYVDYLTKLYPAGYNFIRMASGEEASILMNDDHLTARVCHMGNTIASIHVIGLDGAQRKIYVLDSHYENGDAYIGMYVNHDDGLPLTYVISDVDKATLLERGIKGLYLNQQLYPFQ
ncbi:MAG: hypothetical protein PHE02_10165 [Lachnospiraceae bacterium]|nr:hypothetical protein [Lachnospiraceae bacterium]